MPSPPDPSRIADDQWIYEGESSDGLRRHYLCQIDGYVFRKTENIVEDELLEANRQSFNESFGQRFRDDPIGTRVASIPLNVYYRDIAPRMKLGDKDFMRWWLNREQNRPYRTFRGNL